MKEDRQFDTDAVSSGKAASTSAAGIVGLVLGAVALLTSFLPIINNVSFFFALIGTVFAIVGVVATVRKTRKGKGLAIAGLIICIVSIVVVLGTQSLYSAAIDEAFGPDDNAAASASSSASDNEAAAAAESEAAEGEEKSGSSDYTVTIDDFELAEDYSGEAAIVVTFTFTNGSDEDTSFLSAIHAKCFQNGVQLDTAIVSDIDSGSTLNELKPGATITVQEAYKLDDESEVTVECVEFLSFNDEVIAEETFSLA